MTQEIISHEQSWANIVASAKAVGERNRAGNPLLFQFVADYNPVPGQPSGGYACMMDDYRVRHRAYCDIHGFTYAPVLFAADEIDMRDGWTRLELVLAMLEYGNCETLHMIDADCIIVRMEKDLRETLPDWAWLSLATHPFPDTEDVVHYQTGTMNWRACDDAKAFLRRVMEYRGTGRYINEQCALHAVMLNEPDWQRGKCDIPFQWNNTFCNGQPPAPIIAAFHGYCGNDIHRRRQAMLTWARLQGIVED